MNPMLFCRVLAHFLRKGKVTRVPMQIAAGGLSDVPEGVCSFRLRCELKKAKKLLEKMGR